MDLAKKSSPEEGDEKKHNKSGPHSLIRRINYTDTEISNNRLSNYVISTSDKQQWTKSATTTVRPIYDQIPRPMLFEDDSETDSFSN